MQINKAQFLLSAPNLASCPDPEFYEFAFIGRSNVGKSSLINNLVNQRKPIADVSKTPGRTQMINFYRVNDAWHLIDLPGYGFAKVSGKKLDTFQKFVPDYLLKRENLSCVFALIDSRLSPQKIDLDFIRWMMECEIPFVLVFTKTDKVKPTALKRNIEAFHNAMKDWCDLLPRTFTSSATNGSGRKEILEFIAQAIKASS